MRVFGATIVLCAIVGASARGQSLTAEAAVTAGYSTEERTAVAATQARVFGDSTFGIRYYVEGAWGATTDTAVDAFGAAYPYLNRVQIIEAYAERMFRPGGRILGLKAGRYRTPFGISTGSDYAYSGLLRAPLLRYDGYFALSNDFLEHGVDLIVGVPRLTVEASAGVPADVGDAQRRSGTDVVIHVQSYLGPVIFGASYVRTQPYQPAVFAKGAALFGGLDVRWMRDGVQARGEWLTGRPFDGTSTSGWYADLIVHRVGMGPVTAVARVERLDYEAVSPFDLHTQRQTIGARIRVIDQVAVHVNLLHTTGGGAPRGALPLDLGVTYSIRRP